MAMAEGGAIPTDGKLGVLLINLGTPDAPDVPAVRRYLKQFLSDPRVVEIPALIWQPILRGAILPRRPKKSAAAYRKVWTERGSPLAVVTQDQASALQRDLGAAVLVRYAMRYGAPAIGDVLGEMQAAGCERILLAALYPQYSAATTATAHDAVFATLQQWRSQPAIRTLPPYYNDAAYIDALVASVEAARAQAVFDHLLVSFHGMPQRTADLGDPYADQCHVTAAALAARVSLPVSISFQSRFGRAKWLEPATDGELQRLATAGVRHIGVIAPGFSADCLETLEELAIEGRQQFCNAGGTDFTYIPCLNASPAGITMLATLIRRELAGWH